ncbi:hypothetical protein Poli38472_008013 [Pythium oligandrum]|uniref:L-dopachrome isomerase n=1 Tax=Pythium oligandrum TaxID=41045 RepID=A0A8K1FJW5_PYTOL|nr:hypothetical protein Poli38472_008013 [Pythium oligandrum]|eukprot:TMW65371.1 hypothetical protein Poli38472_008013 [Pythium oligandrum]
MPFIKVATNLPRASFVANNVLKAFSTSLTSVLATHEKAVMVQLEFDQDLILSGSTEPCAFINVRTIGKIDPEHNPKTYEALSATVLEQLNIPANRIFFNLDDIQANNWGYDAKPVGA